jgi:hypothetical protein
MLSVAVPNGRNTLLDVGPEFSLPTLAGRSVVLIRPVLSVVPVQLSE